MKKLLYILIAGILIVGCTKDKTPQERLIGTWTLQYYYVDTLNNNADFQDMYNYVRKELNYGGYSLSFENTACGMKVVSNNGDATYSESSYTIDDLYIHRTERCVDEFDSWFLANMNILYIFQDDQLITAAEHPMQINDSWRTCMFYGVWTK